MAESKSEGYKKMPSSLAELPLEPPDMTYMPLMIPTWKEKELPPLVQELQSAYQSDNMDKSDQGVVFTELLDCQYLLVPSTQTIEEKS
jgi:hypothetical protein